MGISSSQTLKYRIGSQWSQIKTQHQTIIKNNYTQQQFLLHSIKNTELNGVKLYFIREFSTFPHTPKVICLEKQCNQLILLVEKPQQLLSKWLQGVGCQLAMLMKLNDVLSGIYALKNKFGTFIVSERMVQLSVNGNVIIWYNEKFHSNIVQLPLSRSETKIALQNDESVMVQNILEIFRKNQNFSILLYPIIKGIQNFRQLRIVVKRRICQLQKSNLPNDSTQQKQSKLYKRSESISHRQRKTHCRNTSIKLSKQRLQTQTHTQFTSKTSLSIPAKRWNKSFLLQQTQKFQQNQQFQQFNSEKQKRKSYFNQNPFQISNKDSPSSSQRYSSSNASSSNQLIKTSYLHKNSFKPWKSFHQITLTLNSTKSTDMFRKKQCGYKNLAIYQMKEKQSKKEISLIQAQVQQSRRQNASLSFRPISPTHSYKPCQSFSSTKQLSLKSTTGTLKKTREFADPMFRQIVIAERQAIKEESDETYKNSNNYSVETIKQQQKEEQKEQSLTVSQDFNQLFSARQSSGCDEQNEKRQMEFQQVLWGGQ